MFTIYGYGTFNPMKVVATAEELGLEYKFVTVDLGTGENLKPEHLARHPLGKVPVLDHDGHVVFESAAICRYLANVNGKRLYSDDPKQASRIDQVMDTMSIHIGRWLSVYFWEEVICPMFFSRPADAKAIADAKGWLDKQLPYIETVLSENAFLCGNDISIADTFAFASFQIKDSTSVDLSPYPNILRWYDAMKARPAIKKADKVVFFNQK